MNLILSILQFFRNINKKNVGFIANLEKNSSRFVFFKQIGLKIICKEKPDFIALNIDSIIKCINNLNLENIIYIYDNDTNMRFSIEIYKGKYSFGMLNNFRDFEKNELIDFLNQEGLEIFKKIQLNPEKLGFEFEDNGGL